MKERLMSNNKNNPEFTNMFYLIKFSQENDVLSFNEIAQDVSVSDLYTFLNVDKPFKLETKFQTILEQYIIDCLIEYDHTKRVKAQCGKHGCSELLCGCPTEVLGV